MASFSMHFEKCRRGVTAGNFLSEGEGFSGCKLGGGGGKGRVSVLKNKVNTAGGVPLNKNERRADSYVFFLLQI